MSNVNLAAPGNYYISSGKSFAGRDFLKEDRTFDPKKINCPTDERSPDPWSLKLLPSDRYHLSVLGAPTGERDGLVFAFVEYGDYQAEEWIVTVRNAGLYTIEKADKSGGWVKQEGADPQVAVRPLTKVGPGGDFPPNELWSFESLDVADPKK